MGIGSSKASKAKKRAAGRTGNTLTRAITEDYVDDGQELRADSRLDRTKNRQTQKSAAEMRQIELRAKKQNGSARENERMRRMNSDSRKWNTFGTKIRNPMMSRDKSSDDGQQNFDDKRVKGAQKRRKEAQKVAEQHHARGKGMLQQSKHEGGYRGQVARGEVQKGQAAREHAEKEAKRTLAYSKGKVSIDVRTMQIHDKI
jgi:hypothetical protein